MKNWLRSLLESIAFVLGLTMALLAFFYAGQADGLSKGTHVTPMVAQGQIFTDAESWCINQIAKTSDATLLEFYTISIDAIRTRNIHWESGPTNGIHCDALRFFASQWRSEQKTQMKPKSSTEPVTKSVGFTTHIL